MAESSINTHNFTSTTIKFLCSYGGKILPRYPDGKLRYNGGETRVLAVNRSISFYELLLKLGEICGTSMSLIKCQLPKEDLDTLVTIASDEDLANLIEEYDHVSTPPDAIKIRVFLSTPKSVQKVSPTSSIASSSSNNDATSPKSMYSFATAASIGSPKSGEYINYIPRPRVFPSNNEKSARKQPQCTCHGRGNTSTRHVYLNHNGNSWQ